MKTLDQFIAENRISMTADPASHNPNIDATEWDRGARHWRITFTRPGTDSTLTTYFSQGSGLTEDPTAADVLDCLAMDAASYDNAGSFEEWAEEYGLDTDSRSEKRTYNATGKNTDALRAFLDGDQYESLLWDTERV